MIKTKILEVYMLETIKDRLAHILRSKNLTASQFAEMMDIQPSNVSHLLNGRNKPSLDFLIKLKGKFPEYSFDWIILGKKPITMVENFEQKPVEKQLDFDINMETSTQNLLPENGNESHDDVFEEELPHIAKGKIKNIIFVYNDNTFEMLNPRQ